MTDYHVCLDCMRKDGELDKLRKELHGAYKVISDLVHRDNELRRNRYDPTKRIEYTDKTFPIEVVND